MSASQYVATTQNASYMLRDETQDLPPEIMTEIFLFVSGEQVFLSPPEDGYPWILGYVCSRWRQILWSSPTVWNNIEIRSRHRNVPASRALSPDDMIAGGCDIDAILSYVLSRIASPISLSVSTGLFEHVSSTILGNLNRFRELWIEAIPQDVLFSLLELSSTTFPLLEMLTLSASIHGTAPEYTISPFETLPNLCDVMLIIESPTFIPSLLLLPWAKIQDITVEPMRTPPEVIWEIFRSSPCLKSCNFVVESTTPIPVTPEFILPELMELEFETDNNFDWDGFFRPLITPSLYLVVLKAPRIPCAMLESLIIRSRCALKVLDLSEYAHQPHEVGQSDFGVLLDHLPFLVDLKLLQPIPRHVFRKIKAGALPELRTAELVVRPDGFGGFLDILEAFVASQDRRFRRFRLVCITSPGFEARRYEYLSHYEFYHSLDNLDVKLYDGDTLVEIKAP